jgi:hypothetical protein
MIYTKKIFSTIMSYRFVSMKADLGNTIYLSITMIS